MPRQKVVVETQRKKCRKCGRMADAEAFFSRNRKKMSDPNRTNVFGEVYVTTAPGYDLAGHHRRRTICIGCELSARNDPSPGERGAGAVMGSGARPADLSCRYFRLPGEPDALFLRPW